jgi:hypothetical protein
MNDSPNNDYYSQGKQDAWEFPQELFYQHMTPSSRLHFTTRYSSAVIPYPFLEWGEIPINLQRFLIYNGQKDKEQGHH